MIQPIVIRNLSSRSLLPRSILALFILLLSLNAPSWGDEQTELQKLLKRLSLTRLELVNLENQLKDETNPNNQLKIAKQLADLYTKQLLNLSDDPDRFQKMISRVRQLTVRFPKTDSESLRVMLLQAEYIQAEKVINKWLEDRSETKSLQESKLAFKAIATKFLEYRKSIEGEIAKLEESLSDRLPGRTSDRIEERINQLSRVGFRAAYFAGWSNYYYAVCLETATLRKPPLIAAREAFAELLGIDLESKIQEELDPSWFDLSNNLIAQSIVGLGLCEAGLEEEKRSELCFKLLSDASVSYSVARQVPVWRLQSWLNTNQFDIAESLAKKLLKKNSALTEETRTLISVLLVRTGFSTGNSGGQTAARLGQLGLRELVRLRRFSFIESLESKYKIDTSGRDFYLSWLAGYRAYTNAEKTKRKTDYEIAANHLKAATDFPDASSDLPSLALCRTQLGWCKFRLSQFEEAAKLFQQAIPTLKEADKDAAIKTSWMRYECYSELYKKTKEDRFRGISILALEELMRDFPGSQYAKNAEYQLARLKRSSKSPKETIVELRKIKKNNPNYVSALYEICILQHQIWWATRDDENKFKLATNELFIACNNFLNEAASEPASRQMRVLMIGADAGIRQNPPDIARAKTFLDQAAAIAPKIENNSGLIEYRYQLFQAALKTSENATALEHAKWLMEYGAGSPYQKSAVILLAGDLEKQIAAASGNEKKLKMRDAIDLYSRMVGLFGESEDVLAKQKNARVAVSKLAGYYYELGEFSKAADLLGKLSSAVPRDANLLLRAGRAYFAAKDFKSALPIFRRLVKGTEPNSDRWYEAKYHLTYCLAQTDKKNAISVYEQFKKLHPNPPKPWDDRFANLGELLQK